MKDSTATVDQRYRAMLLARSGEERLKMGCSMSAIAKVLVRASILAEDPKAPESAIRRGLFLRFYEQDFAPEVRGRILKHLV